MPSARFLSLKWKALLATSLVLVLVTGSFAFLNYYEFHKQFQERREAVYKQQSRQVQGLLEQTAKRLQQLGTTVASLSDIQVSLTAGPATANTDSLNRLISTLQLNLGIEAVAVFSGIGDPVAYQGMPAGDGYSQTLSTAVRQAIKDELPHGLYECMITCLQFAVVPVLGAEHRVVGAVLLGVSPADVVLEFQRVSGTDMGLMVLPSADNAMAGDSHPWLSQWRGRVVALSNSDRNLKLLRRAAESHPALGSLEVPRQIPFDARSYEVRLVPLAGFDPTERAFLVFIADISDELLQIRLATQRTIAQGAAGLVISEALLLSILWGPMSRLRRVAGSLPRLAESAFAEVRAAIAGSRRRPWSRDELDVLDDTAIALSNQLEELNTEVTDRTRDLSERMQELAQERDFVTHVLDTAQAIIVTQNRQQEILGVNRYAEALTGYTMTELHGRPFVTLLAQDALGPGLTTRLSDLTAGKKEHLEDEWDVRSKDGSALNIVWHHSRLDGQFRDAPAVLSIGMDITARKRAELKLAWLADHDPLTGLFNRRRFQEELKEAIAAARRYQHSGALLFFDLDQFKYINDTSGHRVGDLLLERLGESLPRLLREVDIIGRLGGDEFAAVLPRATSEEAVQVAKKILTHIRDTEFRAQEHVHKVSASIGIALFPQAGNDVQDLLAHADLAMYQVKDTGRGGWHLFSSEDQSRRLIQERVVWKERVERALAERRFILYVQPIVNIRDASTSHYEVLLRMRGEDGNIVHPAQFIQVAERTGLIHAVDRMVLAEAIHCQAALQRRGRTVTFCVNLSAHAFNDPELLTRIEDLLNESELDPEQLVLEMTETAAVADLVAAKRLLDAIRDLGCRFALDDFGTGFSSFFYLRELPIDFVKIDGSFIRNLGARPDDQALVRAMGQIARGFGKKTVAEHVENAETLRLLEEYEIDFAQGYFTGRPAPVAEVFGT